MTAVLALLRGPSGRWQLAALTCALYVAAPGLLAVAWTLADMTLARIGELGVMFGIGVFGAIIANTSGTGGGVVFVPVFNIMRHEGLLDLTREQIVAAAFLIQCCGMSTGAVTWTRFMYRDATPNTGIAPRHFWLIVFGVLALAAPTMIATQYLTEFDPRTVLFAFKLFSISLGVILIVTTWTVNATAPERTALAPVDMAALGILAVLGGFVTAQFSVGLGEFVALYLFIRHYPLVTCTAAAVIMSAVMVWLGAIYNISEGLVPWEVIAIAGPGAICGGYLARRIAIWLGSKRLKTLDGGWIVLSSLYLLALNV